MGMIWWADVLLPQWTPAITRMSPTQWDVHHTIWVKLDHEDLHNVPSTVTRKEPAKDSFISRKAIVGWSRCACHLFRGSTKLSHTPTSGRYTLLTPKSHSYIHFVCVHILFHPLYWFDIFDYNSTSIFIDVKWNVLRLLSIKLLLRNIEYVNMTYLHIYHFVCFQDSWLN